jgi:hypothetical protein
MHHGHSPRHGHSENGQKEVGISVYGTMGRMGAKDLVAVGGTLPLPPDYKSHRKQVDHRHHAFLPLFLFVASLASFTWLFFFHAAALLIGLFFALAGCILVMFTGDSIGPQRFIALCSLVALLLGAPSGWYIHEKRVQYWYALQYGQHYSNVVPTQLAAAHADASIISFEAEAIVDTAFTSGYRSIGQGGHVFCAAPITAGGDPTGQVQFFAVGRDCCCRPCPALGILGLEKKDEPFDFDQFRDCCKDQAQMTCDGVGTEGRHTGIVIHDFGTLPSRSDHYRDAVKLAAATWDLPMAEEPIMVRWVEDSQVDATIAQWKWEATYYMFGVMIFGLVALYYGISMGLWAIFGGTEAPMGAQ